jgi:hypothetical protein
MNTEQKARDWIAKVENFESPNGAFEIISALLAARDAEPVAYITPHALDALKRAASSSESVHVWLHTDYSEDDIALYIKENL